MRIPNLAYSPPSFGSVGFGYFKALSPRSIARVWQNEQVWEFDTAKASKSVKLPNPKHREALDKQVRSRRKWQNHKECVTNSIKHTKLTFSRCLALELRSIKPNSHMSHMCIYKNIYVCTYIHIYIYIYIYLPLPLSLIYTYIFTYSLSSVHAKQ